MSRKVPRFVIIGAGQRGSIYAKAIADSGIGAIAAVAEPIHAKRVHLLSEYGDAEDILDAYNDWQTFVKVESERQVARVRGEDAPPAIDAAFVCVLDEHHAEVVKALALLGLHIMCEKPLATNLRQCLDIYSALRPDPTAPQDVIFGIGHVLRYTPHNLLLRRLVLQERLIGDILSIEHVEPVGQRHFSHSYVRGNWRREDTTGPSLLTKSCHDIDWLLWMLCEPGPTTTTTTEASIPHLPSSISSVGSLKFFRKSRKPPGAGNATNCLSCPLQTSCTYSAPRIYYDQHLGAGVTGWPVNVVSPDIEQIYANKGSMKATEVLFETLAQDYEGPLTPDVAERPWFGRCVFESDNDVVDDQFVTMEWEDETNDDSIESVQRGPTSGSADPVVVVDSNSGSGSVPDSTSTSASKPTPRRSAKTASFHMIAHTESQCTRRGRIYGSKGELTYDGDKIEIFDFDKRKTTRRHVSLPRQTTPTSATAIKGIDHFYSSSSSSGHGGGDGGLALQFAKAVRSVVVDGTDPGVAQGKYLGCSIEEVVRSHAVVFAAEDARKGRCVVDFREWWEENIGDLVPLTTAVSSQGGEQLQS